jgi:protein-S-isoprenylcysteine O-methyltransferase Ste14
MASISNLTITIRASRVLRSVFALLRLLMKLRVALPEILTTAALLGGWLLLTLGVVALTSPVAWLFSGGLLLLSLGGWKLAWALVTNGLYALTRPEKAAANDG